MVTIRGRSYTGDHKPPARQSLHKSMGPQSTMGTENIKQTSLQIENRLVLNSSSDCWSSSQGSSAQAEMHD